MELVPRVLIVDDDADTLRLYRFALELLGCHVVAAGSARDALRAASANPPQVVVTDLAMPEMDGIELCLALKACDETRHIPVLAVSGQAIHGYAERARAAGCREVLLKPCLPEDLFATIARVIEDASRANAQAGPVKGQGRPLRREAGRAARKESRRRENQEREE